MGEVLHMAQPGGDDLNFLTRGGQRGVLGAGYGELLRVHSRPRGLHHHGQPRPSLPARLHQRNR